MTNFLYNPDRKSKEQLKAEFVVRTKVLDDIMQDIESSTMQTPEQHYLLVGQRGTGKTTLLHRIKYAVEDNAELNQWLVPVIFSEEQYNVSELANLWENVAHNLEDYHGFTGISAEMEQHIAKNNFEELCYDILEKYLKQHNKKIILLIDNIGDLLKKLEDKEVRRLRELLQTKPLMRLVAGSPFYLDSILDYKQPFFEFFKVIRLDGLNKEETQELLSTLGEVHGEKEKIERIIKETPERIETLRILSGGVPRTIALMFRIFIDHEHENSLKDLERMLDAVTPLYKHRMDDLPKQQQRIVDAVARNWDAISVKELKEKVRLESKVISAQLRQLEKNQIIEKRETNTKNHLYLLRERFWNIWYLMRYGRKTDSERVVWLVRFLESWCNEMDFENRINKFVTELKSGAMNEETSKFYGEVYASIKKIQPHLRYLLKSNIPKNISKNITITEDEALSLSAKYFQNSDIANSIKILLEPLLLSHESKAKLYSMISDLEYEEAASIFDELFDGVPGSTIGLITEGQVLFALFVFQLGIMNSIRLKDELTGIEDQISVLIILINAMDKKRLSAELYPVLMFITYMIISEKYSIAYKLFEEIQIVNLREVFKPFYYSLIYFHEGNVSEKLNNFGSEVKESAEPIILSIARLKKTI